MQKDYDAYYQILRIPAGSALAEVEAAWKHWAPLVHPDNFTGTLKDRAQSELAKINNARDELRTWWSSNSQPPPSAKAPSPGSAPAPAQAPQPGTQESPGPKPGPRQDKTWQEQAYEDWKKQHPPGGSGQQERNWRGYAPPPGPQSGAAPEPPPKSKVPSKPIGPNPLVKQWNHHFYDLMNSSRDDAAVPSMLVWAALFVVPGLVVPLVLAGIIGSIISGFPAWLVFALVLPFAIALWRIVFADKDIYAIEVNPYLQPCPAPAVDAMNKVTSLIDGQLFDGKKWELAASDLAPDDDILAKDWTMSFKAGERSYRIKLNVRIRQTDQHYQSMVSYWFDIDALPDWRIPAAKVVKSTDEALWRGLKA